MSGVSIRTLHYYDEIGLLKPAEVSMSGYRYYDDNSVALLQQILFYRELDFSLKDIGTILSDPNYNRNEALIGQKKLLTLKCNRLNGLIDLINKTMEGECTMSFNEFNTKDIDNAKAKYAAEVKERWGDTAEYAESVKKDGKRSKDEQAAAIDAMNDIFRQFAAVKGTDPASAEAQQLVAKWQKYITDNFYECNKQVLAGLGEMYTADERFKGNLDKFGAGTAEFMSCAIKKYCE